VGCKMTWDGNKNAGSGIMTIVENTPNEMVKINLNFKGEGEAIATLKLTPEAAGTKVTWGFDMDAGMNPIARLMGAMMDKMLGSTYEKGLNSLKRVMENKPPDSAPLSAEANPQQ